MADSMTVGRMILREIQRAKLNAALCLAVVLCATGLLVAMLALTRASVDATRIMMRDMGHNLLITPPGADLARYQALDFTGADMPEEYVTQLAESTVLAEHFVAKYQVTTKIDECTVVLTGVLAETLKLGSRKKPLPTAYDVPEGRVLVRAAAADALGVQPGDSITIMGKPFVVDKVLEAQGVIPEDIRVFAPLHDVQELVGKPGRINAIDALSCKCVGVNPEDIRTYLMKSVREVLPDVNIETRQSILVARHEQRAIVYRLQVAAVIIVIIGSATAIWGLTYQNVRNRRREIGVLRALGVTDGRITAIFVGKILGYSVLGAVLGAIVGYGVAVWFNTTGQPIAVPAHILAGLIASAPVASILFGLPPIILGLSQEPTEVLKDAVG